VKHVLIHRSETWVKYHPSKCEGCWAGCCTLPVPVTSEELHHMGFIEADEVNGPLKRIARRLIREGIIQSFNARTRLFTINQVNGDDCVFLDENRRCKIYDRRPSICRRFPMNSVRPGHCPNQPIAPPNYPQKT
jgi:Fe-S-cluster containining protein